MSFQIFVHSFDRTCVADSEDLFALAAPFLDSDRSRLMTADGGAHGYGFAREPIDSLMFDHASGEAVYDLSYELARRSGWVVMPIGCPVCITDAAHAASLRSELVADAGVVIIHSAKDLMSVIRSA